MIKAATVLRQLIQIVDVLHQYEHSLLWSSGEKNHLLQPFCILLTANSVQRLKTRMISQKHNFSAWPFILQLKRFDFKLTTQKDSPTIVLFACKIAGCNFVLKAAGGSTNSLGNLIQFRPRLNRHVIFHARCNHWQLSQESERSKYVVFVGVYPVYLLCKVNRVCGRYNVLVVWSMFDVSLGLLRAHIGICCILCLGNSNVAKLGAKL